MATAVTPFRNRDNYAKFQLFYYEAGTNVIIQVLKWLYTGKRPIEENLIELAKTSSIQRQNQMNSAEKNTFEDLKRGKIKISDLDFTLLYKLTQLVCGLAPRNESVWTSHCPLDRQDELEQLLFILKSGRNHLAHPSSAVKNITDSDVDEKSEAMKHLLTSILQQAGQRVNEDAQKVDGLADFIKKDIDRICSDDKIEISMKCHVKNLVLNDLKATYEDGSNASLEMEQNGYSVPYLKINDTQRATFLLNDILTFDNCSSNGIIIQGEAGDGKTALTRFLFNSWLTGTNTLVNEMSSLDIVLRIECRHVDSRDVSQFFEDQFPNASYSFSNTSSLKKHLDEFKVLWIMDGYDESTAEFKSFLKTVTKRFPKRHKLIITTRPSTYDELAKSLSAMAVVTLSLEPLRDSNIEEIIQNFIPTENKKREFRTEFRSLDESAKTLLRAPLNMTLYIELWLADACQANGSYTSKILFSKTTLLQLRRLEKRLDERTSLPQDDLTRKLDKWFYGSLCRQSFFLAMRWSKNISHAVVEILKEDASDFLIPSYCLSSFLVETKGREGKHRYDFKHEIQQYVLASLFIKKLNPYSSIPLKESLSNIKCFPVVKLLNFYVKMCLENGSINSDARQVFNSVKEIISIFTPRQQCLFWCFLCFATDFNKKFMKNVSQILKKVAVIDTNIFPTYLEVAKFVRYVHPQKVRFIIKNYMNAQQRDELLKLLEVLEENQTEIYLHTVFDELDDVIGTSAIDKFNDAPIKITSLSGTVAVIPLLRNHHRYFQTLEVVIYTEREFFKLNEFLQNHKTLTEIKIYIIFDTFGSSPLTIPKEIILNTTLTFRLVTEDNFEYFILFLLSIRGDHDVKFKAIFYGMEKVSLSLNEKLDEFATVVIVEKNTFFRRLPRRPEFLMYTTTMEADEVDNWLYNQINI